MTKLHEHMGAALLGSTAPDRRVMTREPREETHYFDLAEGKMGDGFQGMKEALPDMTSRAPAADWTLTAFLVGCASHLAADEAWIVNVYRPYFGDDKYLGGEPTRNILDRAVQFEAELEVRTDTDQLREWAETGFRFGQHYRGRAHHIHPIWDHAGLGRIRGRASADDGGGLGGVSPLHRAVSR